PWSDQFFKNSMCRIVAPFFDQLLTEHQVAENPNNSLHRDAGRELVTIVDTPNPFHHCSDRFQVIGDQFERPVGLSAKVLHEKLFVLDDKLLDLIEKFGLQDPLLLPATAAKPVDFIL